MTKKSFLVFCVDQMQAACLGAHGHPDVKTPNLDRLVGGGTSFRRAYCSNSVCMPSRAGLITGLTPRQHGLVTNGGFLPADVPTLPGALAEAGWRTHAVGKLHLQPWFPFCYSPEGAKPGWSWEDRQRWDDGTIKELPLPYYGFQGVDKVGGHVDYSFGNYRQWLDREHPDMHRRYGRPEGRLAAFDCWTCDVPPSAHYNDWIAERSSAFIRDLPRKDSFFLWCSFPDPHHPFSACREYREMFDAARLTLPPTWNRHCDLTTCQADFRGEYQPAVFDEHGLREVLAQTYGMIVHIDACIGRVLDALERCGRRDDTVIIFTADHGEYLGAHHLLCKNLWHLEPLIRVPFVWNVPGQKGRGVRDEVVGHLDLVPTILEMAGLHPLTLWKRPRGGFRRGGISEPIGLPGRSMARWLAGGDGPSQRPAVVEFDCDNSPGKTVRVRTVVDGDWKLTYYATHAEGVLVNLAEDPDETLNRWSDASCISVRARLLERLVETLTLSDRLETTKIAPA